MALIVCVGGHIRLELWDKVGRKTEGMHYLDVAKVTSDRLKRMSAIAALKNMGK